MTNLVEWYVVVSVEACAMIEALDTEHFISNVLSEILFNEPINTTSVQHGIIF